MCTSPHIRNIRNSSNLICELYLVYSGSPDRKVWRVPGDDHWTMTYTFFDGVGYQVGKATSKDLVNWDRFEARHTRPHSIILWTALRSSQHPPFHLVLNHAPDHDSSVLCCVRARRQRSVFPSDGWTRAHIGVGSRSSGVLFSPRAERPPIDWNSTPGDFDYGGAAFVGPLLRNYNVSAPRELLQVDGQYWFTYFAQPVRHAIEPPPGATGLAASSDGQHWVRAAQVPPLKYPTWKARHRGCYRRCMV